MIIKSSSALRNDYSMISDLAHDEAEPIYITKNGGGDLRPGFDSLFFCSTKKDTLFGMSFVVERAKGIEPSTQAWEARILPLNYARICGRRSRPTILYYLLFKTSTTLAGILRHFSSEMDASETRRPMASGTRKIPSASSSRLAEAGSSQGIDAKNPPS